MLWASLFVQFHLLITSVYVPYICAVVCYRACVRAIVHECVRSCVRARSRVCGCGSAETDGMM